MLFFFFFVLLFFFFFFFFQAEDGIRDHCVTGVQTCALPIYLCLTLETLFQLHLLRLLGFVGTAIDGLIERHSRFGDKFHGLTRTLPEIGRASCREKCRSRWWAFD